MVERRSILRTMGWAGLGLLLKKAGLVSVALHGSESPLAFEEVPPAASGISWTHVGGKSHDMYLPETVGAGCAFLDYDNDGWMDIYLVNSGPSDFYSPTTSLKNALYRNNHNG